jgi:E3 ubiquitin-protein ligase UBR4
LAYDRSVKLVKCLSVIAEVAAARPYNWQKYCSRHIDVVQFLLQGVFFFGEESVVQSLKLLTLVFYTGQDSAGYDNGVSASDAVSGGSTIVAAATRASIPTLDGKKKKRSSGDQTGVHDKVHLDMEMECNISTI